MRISKPRLVEELCRGSGVITEDANDILCNTEVEGTFHRKPGLSVELDRNAHQSRAAPRLCDPGHTRNLRAAEVGAAKTGEVALILTCCHFQVVRCCGRSCLSRHPARRKRQGGLEHYL